MTAKQDEFGRSELHCGASDGNAPSVRQLLAQGLEADLGDSNGWTPLHFAAQARSAVVELLHKAGASVDATDQHGDAPLFTAVFNSRGEGELISLLRADAFQANHHGQTPVALARLISDYGVAGLGVSGPQIVKGWYGQPWGRLLGGSATTSRTDKRFKLCLLDVRKEPEVSTC